MIIGQMLNINNDWDCRLYLVKNNIQSNTLGIYRNKNSINSKYEVHWFENGYSDDYFPTFKKAAISLIKYLKNDPKYIPDIMRLTALMSEED